MKFLIILICVFVIASVIGSYVTSRFTIQDCVLEKTEHLPYIRTFTEEQTQPTDILNLYSKMFVEHSPWDTKNLDVAKMNIGGIQPSSQFTGRPKTLLVGMGTNRDNYLNQPL